MEINMMIDMKFVMIIDMKIDMKIIMKIDMKIKLIKNLRFHRKDLISEFKIF